MPDHLHIVLALPPQQRLGRVVQLIKGRFSNRYNRLNQRERSVWQSRYHERALRSERELIAAIDYTHENPVEAGLTSQAESFLWSSANPAYLSDLKAYLA